MDENEGQEDGLKVTYFLSQCLHCPRILYIVVDAKNWCGACFNYTTARTITNQDDDEEESDDGEN